MSIEVSSAVMLKLLTPIVSVAVKDLSAFLKDYKYKWDSEEIVRKISRKIIDINTVKTMWSKDRGVVIDSFYFPSRVVEKYSKANVDVLRWADSSHVVLEGIVGQGKSIFMRYACNAILAGGVIPIFIEMRMISATHGLTELILEYLEGCGIKGGIEAFSYLAVQGKVALLLDGFDEIPSTLMKAAIVDVERLRVKYEDLKIIMSSRPYHVAQNLQGFNVYALAELESDDYEPFLRKMISDSVDRFGLTEAISQAPKSIKGIITTPLMLTLLVLVYKNEHEIPSTLPIFFDKLFTTVFSGHDKLKAGFRREHFTGLSEAKIQSLFDAFCMAVMKMGGKRTINFDEFKTAFNIAIKYNPDSRCEVEEFRKDIVHASCLMLEDGVNETTFLHKSIMEFHAASFLKNAPDSAVEKFYSIAPDDILKWETVLSFLSSIDSYRYGVFYVLPEYPRELSRLAELLASPSKPGLIKYIDATFPGFEISMSNLRVASINTGARRFNAFTLNVQRLLYGRLFRAFEESDAKAIQTAIRQSPQTADQGMITIGTRSVVENIDISLIWDDFAELERLMIEEVDKYKKLVEVERSKEKIFDLF